MFTICKLLHCHSNGMSTVMLQVGNASSCPRLVTPTNPYTVHLNVSEGLVISGSNFIEVTFSLCYNYLHV